MRRWWAAAALAVCACVGAGAQGADTSAELALLRAVGALTGSNAYTTYMALGSAADSYAGRIYTPDKALSVLRALRTLAQEATRGLSALQGAPFLHPQDRVYVRDMVEAYSLLVAQADGFETWVRTGSRDEFDRARDLAWAAIHRTLGSESETAPPGTPTTPAAPQEEEEGLE